ncbi:MAG: carbon-nitrogen hydrolase family protein [Kiritimatiellae bacterium]|nr:carbon-nitrogen hydrolase family protein [Kiritimatiellia bacterium]
MSESAPAASAPPLKVGVAQFETLFDLDGSKAAILRNIRAAKTEGCRLVAIPEGALNWPDGTPRADIDAAVEEIRAQAGRTGIYVCLGVTDRDSDDGQPYQRGVVIGPDGEFLLNYKKTHDVPACFEVDGVRCNIAVCSDRWMREYADLPCLVQGSRIVIELSGGHGGDDGRPDLRWVRYRPWAQRNGAFLVLSSAVHNDEPSWWQQLPWGGHSAIFNPDGTFAAQAHYERECLLTATLDPALATRREAEKRRNHPLLKPFWDAGEALLNGARPPELDALGSIESFESPEADVKIAAAQLACSRSVPANIRAIRERIAAAAEQGADIVVFPELAVTGSLDADIAAAGPAALAQALPQIAAAARGAGIHVLFGMPHTADGARTNSAFAIGPDGGVLTRYDQINVTRPDLFTPGRSTKAMWFHVKGVHAVVTIGDDVLWTELGELAAWRGAQLQFHVGYAPDTSRDGTLVRKMQCIQMVSFGTYSAVVNAADPSGLSNPSGPANGGSMICEHYAGGHHKPDPGDVELYLPYHANVILSAGSGDQLIAATRKTRSRNTYLKRRRPAWRDWFVTGMRAIESEI